MKNNNNSRIILDLCGGTGAWSKPYRDAGYDVRLLTLPRYDVTEVLHTRRCLLAGTDGVYSGVPYTDVYGVLAAPPCTEFSIAKGSQPHDFESAMRVVRACMEIIWRCRERGGLKFWALENPVGFLRQFLGVPRFTFEQWQYGANAAKRTDVWGYFNPPTPTVKVKPERMTTSIGHHAHGIDWSKPIIPAEYKALNLSRAAARAITPAGFAKAFFRTNK